MSVEFSTPQPSYNINTGSIHFLHLIRNFAYLAVQNAPSKNSDQTAQMRSLIRIFAGRMRMSEGTFSDVAAHFHISNLGS